MAPKNAASKRKAWEKINEPAAKVARVSTNTTSTTRAAPKAQSHPHTRASPKPSVPTNMSTEVTLPETEIKPKKQAAARVSKTTKKLPVLNPPPTEVLDIFVFGEGSAGELGLGAGAQPGGKSAVDVARPRLNHRLDAKDLGVVAMAVGGMHCVALTRDNKILTWGVNDQGALGRITDAAPMRDLAEDEDSDSDSDAGSGLNPSEAEPREIDVEYFAEGTRFASVYAGDSCTYALTTTGLVYGWGTFRGNEGILGFTKDVQIARRPILIPELKNITSMACGTNHVLAIDTKGKAFVWGTGEQNQLGRRVVARTATGALVPREFGMGRKKIVTIGCGDYHCFAIDSKGDTYSWGLNSFGQTGISKDDEEELDTILVPTLVKNLQKYKIKQVTGGAHHTLAVTSEGEVLFWGRIDGCQGGMKTSEMPKEKVFFGEAGNPRYVKEPLHIPDINGEFVASGPETLCAVTKTGKAYTWGFGENHQTAQGSARDVEGATLVDNTAVRDKNLIWAGIGGQFGVLAAVREG